MHVLFKVDFKWRIFFLRNFSWLFYLLSQFLPENCWWKVVAKRLRFVRVFLKKNTWKLESKAKSLVQNPGILYFLNKRNKSITRLRFFRNSNNFHLLTPLCRHWLFPVNQTATAHNGTYIHFWHKKSDINDYRKYMSLRQSVSLLFLL